MVRFRRLHSNVSDGLAEKEPRRRFGYNPDGTGFRIYASGPSHAVGLAIDLNRGLWGSVNERDELATTPPDYITRIQENASTGWGRGITSAIIRTRVMPANTRAGRQGHRAGRCCYKPFSLIVHDVLHGQQISGPISRRHLRSRTWFVEPRPPHRLQNHLCPDQGWKAAGDTDDFMTGL